MTDINREVAETWLAVHGYPNYEVSNYGGIRSYNHKNGRRKKPQLLKPHYDVRGYAIVQLWGGNKCKAKGLHRLVLETFTGVDMGDGYHAAHKDGNASNNNIDNLYWATARENILDKWRHGTMPVGEDTNASKLTLNDVKEIRNLSKNGFTGRQICRLSKFPVHYTTICRVIKGSTWSCMI